MAADYREHIDDDRLAAVAQHVHDWLYAAAEPMPEAKPKREAKPEAKRRPRASKTTVERRPVLRVVG